jgi:hypothetical protein
LKQANPKGQATQICFKIKGTSCPEVVCKNKSKHKKNKTRPEN